MAKYIILALIGVGLLVFPFKKLMNKKAAIPFRIGGAVLIAIAVIWYFAPRGKGSLFAEEGIGSGEGAYDAATESTETSGTEIAKEDVEIVVSEQTGDVIVRVAEDLVYYGDFLCEETDILKSLLEETDLNGRDLILVDDYAYAYLYHEVEDVLEELSITPVRRTAGEEE
jgi:hypothetical protein